MGLNTYKIFLSEKSRGAINAVKSNEEMLHDLKYNNQFQFIDKTFINDGEPIKNFFEVIL